MSNLVDLSDWTPDLVHYFKESFHALKEAEGEKPLALTPEQRDIAVQLGLMSPLNVMAEIQVEGKMYRGLLHRNEDDGIYQGSVFPVTELEEGTE